jgi:hypothetical protein
MKKIISGEEAYKLLLSTPAPTHTKTYKPYSHVVAYTKTMTELILSGLTKTTKETYRISHDGKLALFSFVMDTPQFEHYNLVFTVFNSYSKNYGFKMMIGACDKLENNTVFSMNLPLLTSSILEDGKLQDYVKNLTFMENTKEFDEKLKVFKSKTLDKNSYCSMIGQLYFEESLLTSYQMSVLKKEMQSKNWFENSNAYDFFKYCAKSLNEAHPIDWITSQTRLTDIMCEVTSYEETVVLDKLGEVFSRPYVVPYEAPKVEIESKPIVPNIVCETNIPF